MKIFPLDGWIFYIKEGAKFDDEKIGKWMYFFQDEDFVSDLCKESIETDVVNEAKHSDKNDGVACFYLNCDDLEGHKRVISYFLEKNIIPKTKKGRLYNISFKLDAQTSAGEYGADFKSKITLSNFINLDTKEWLV